MSLRTVLDTETRRKNLLPLSGIEPGRPVSSHSSSRLASSSYISSPTKRLRVVLLNNFSFLLLEYETGVLMSETVGINGTARE
jgi:hypothetical protein